MIPEILPPITIKDKRILNAGLLLSLVYVIFQLINNQFFEVGDTSFTVILLMILSYVILLFILFNALRNYKKEENIVNLPFGRGFRFCFLACIILSVITFVFSLIYFQFINPGYIDTLYNMQMAELEKQGLGSEEIETTSAIFKVFFKPVSISVMSFFGSLVSGIIMSLIVAAFASSSDKKASV